MSRGQLTRRAGIVGAVLGITAAGVAAGVAAERYLARRSRKGEDPYADEPFGDLPSTETRTVTTDAGLDLHVEIVEPDDPEVADGDGADEADADVTLVFVHGFCLDMGTFHFQRRAFSGEYRMVFYDQPGHGRSGKLTKGEYSLDDLGRALRRVIEQVTPSGRIVLVGHSMGGMAIMALAEQWPELFAERVAGVVFVSTSGGDLDRVTFGFPQIVVRFRGPLLPVVRTAGPAAAGVVDRARHASTDLAWLLTRRYGFGDPRPSPSLVSYVEHMNAETSLDVIARYLQTLHGHSRLFALTPLAAVPVLVMCGDHDLMTPLEHSQAIAKALPDAELVVIPNGGHVALMEFADEVNEVLAGFFEKVSAATQGPPAGSHGIG